MIYSNEHDKTQDRIVFHNEFMSDGVAEHSIYFVSTHDVEQL